MVLNLCLPHLKTTAQCNKLCADGYEVSNLLSGDPAALRRGCRLEYFLRPPLHVTLHFQVRVEIYRVDVEFLPCGSAQRRLEILTCSEVNHAKTSENDYEREAFKLVGRCELRDEVIACFKHPNFKPRPPFLECPLDPPAHAKQQELWSRGSQSLSLVTQLRVSVPYVGASSVLGIKSLVVWGVPARCCSLTELEQFQKAYTDSLQPKISSFSILSSGSTSARSHKQDVSSVKAVPEEFLDPLTQELMVLPMILPSGMVVDNSTLEQYEKREAAWGRMPNDPFTGVPFTKDSKPLPNPLLKSRIDSLLLQIGHAGIRSKKNLLNKPQPSRLICASVSQTDLLDVQSSRTEMQTQQIYSASTVCSETLKNHPTDKEKNHNTLTKGLVKPFVDGYRLHPGSSRETCSIRKKKLGDSNKRKCQSRFSSSTEHLLTTFLSPLTKIPRTETSITQSTETNSHEERLSQSLDHALSSALHGLPSYTSQSNLETDITRDHSRCGSCSCSLTIYSLSPMGYSLPCGHLLCRQCVQHEHISRTQRLPIACPTCQALASPSTIIRVHP